LSVKFFGGGREQNGTVYLGRRLQVEGERLLLQVLDDDLHYRSDANVYYVVGATHFLRRLVSQSQKKPPSLSLSLSLSIMVGRKERQRRRRGDEETEEGEEGKEGLRNEKKKKVDM